MHSTEPTKVTSRCPSGHKVRGDVALTGENVVCPGCEVVFTFGVSDIRKPTVSDTGVMRILGELPKPSEGATSLTNPESKSTVPCGRCGVAIDEAATVCKHCNAYASNLPSFLRSMMSPRQVG